jgi:chloride channel protein, CIC family
MAGIAIVIACIAALTAQVLVHLIAFFTNLAFYGQISFHEASPAHHHLGLLVIFVPVAGGVVVGLMARYGSKAIRGHGIPEAMEQVLTNKSRIPPRMTFLKPVSAAIAIGTGGPFGAEGPIIATGGALGSLVGQIMHTTAVERKILLASGAAAGMSAVFGSPVSAVILAVELLLFEYRPRSIIPVALASTAAAGVRVAFSGSAPVFPMPEISAPGLAALALYVLIGTLCGLFAVVVTRAVYWVEDAFEHLPLHWMWWPALGGIAVGVVGFLVPRTLGVGYDNIGDIISNRLEMKSVLLLCAAKFVSWCISLGSGTSGGTLAPLLTIGAGVGSVAGYAALSVFPDCGVDLKIAALVGMAALFGGASRAVLASAVFAFETTLQPLGLLPLLGGCMASYLVSCLLMRNSIMTEKIARRGVRVPSEYSADFLDQISVSEVASKGVVAINAGDTVAQIREWLNSGSKGTSHQGFPVMTENGVLVGVLTRRDLLNAAAPVTRTARELLKRPPVIVYSDCSLRDAADHMVNHGIGRLPVVTRGNAAAVIGMISRSDILSSYRKRIDDTHRAETIIDVQPRWLGRTAG